MSEKQMDTWLRNFAQKLSESRSGLKTIDERKAFDRAIRVFVKTSFELTAFWAKYTDLEQKWGLSNPTVNEARIARFLEESNFEVDV